MIAHPHADRHNRRTHAKTPTPTLVLKTGDGVQPRPWVRIPPPPLSAPKTPWLSVCVVWWAAPRIGRRFVAISRLAQPGGTTTMAGYRPTRLTLPATTPADCAASADAASSRVHFPSAVAPWISLDSRKARTGPGYLPA